MPNAADVMKLARERVNEFLGRVVSKELFDEWSQAANALYKEQYAKKQNPYGEPWEPRAGDEKRTKSYYKFGKIEDVERDGFAMAVAGPNAKRSCVPFEPRGLGSWRPKFDEILKKRTRLLFRSVRP